jgi:uncharacterized protein
MSISIHGASVATFCQILGGLSGVLEKGRAHLSEAPGGAAEIVGARLYPDMLDFRKQVQGAVMMSVGAIDALRTGKFQPRVPGSDDDDYPALQAMVSQAIETLDQIAPDDVNDCAGKEILFEGRTARMRFTVEDFIQSHALPNFYFHVTITYGLLRARGVPIGKRDFVGQIRTADNE